MRLRTRSATRMTQPTQLERRTTHADRAAARTALEPALIEHADADERTRLPRPPNGLARQRRAKSRRRRASPLHARVRRPRRALDQRLAYDVRSSAEPSTARQRTTSSRDDDQTLETRDIDASTCHRISDSDRRTPIARSAVSRRAPLQTPTRTTTHCDRARSPRSRHESAATSRPATALDARSTASRLPPTQRLQRRRSRTLTLEPDSRRSAACCSFRPPNGLRVSGERRAEGDERVRCTRVLGAAALHRATCERRLDSRSPSSNAAAASRRRADEPRHGPLELALDAVQPGSSHVQTDRERRPRIDAPANRIGTRSPTSAPRASTARARSPRVESGTQHARRSRNCRRDAIATVEPRSSHAAASGSTISLRRNAAAPRHDASAS